MDALVHLGYGLSALGWVCKDMLLLRSLSVGSSTVVIANNLLFTPQTNMNALCWQALFIGLNTWQLAQLVAERRARRLPEAEEQMWTRVFQGFARADFLRLHDAAEIVALSPGVVLTTQGQAVSHLTLLIDGAAEVQRGGQVVTTLEGGQFVGSVGFFNLRGAEATVTITQPAIAWRWQADALRALMEKTPGLRLQLLGLIGRELGNQVESLASLAGKMLSPYARAQAQAQGQAQAPTAPAPVHAGRERSPFYQAPK